MTYNLTDLDFPICKTKRCAKYIKNVTNADYTHFATCHFTKYCDIILHNELVNFEKYILNFFVEYVNNSTDDVKSKSCMIERLLCYMAEYARIEMMQLLMDSLNFRINDEDNQKIISNVIINSIDNDDNDNNSKTIGFLIELGADINANSNPNALALDPSAETYLWHVCIRYKRNGHIIAKLLLEKGADPNTMDYLHLACESGQSKVAEILLQYGANVSAGAMASAISDRQEHVVKLMLNNGANIEETTSHFYEFYGKTDSKLIDLLLDAGMDPVTMAKFFV